MSYRRLADIAMGGVAGAVFALLGSAAPQAGAAGNPEEAEPAAASRPLSSAAPGVQARALAVIDGDSFEARVNAFPGQEIVTRIRIAGLDAPERRGRCGAETEAAEAAAQALEAMIGGRALTLTEVRGDKYFGRVVARAFIPGSGDVAAAMIAGGHGRAYSGGRRGGWC